MLDPLTGIPNRRYFSEAYESEWKRALRKNESIAILMLDLDFFKGINDAHGHVYGDDCLVQIAESAGGRTAPWSRCCRALWRRRVYRACCPTRIWKAPERSLPDYRPL